MPKRYPSDGYQDEQVLRELYRGLGDQSKIGEIFDVDQATIHYWMDKHGIEARQFPDVETRLKQRHEKDAESGCWVWQGYRTEQGYGRMSINGDPEYAHRASYRVFRGEIEDGKQINHICHNEWCINPDHLYLGTQSENAKDAMGEGDWPEMRGEDHGNSKLTESDVSEIRERYAEGDVTYRDLAEDYPVDKSNIEPIINWRTWSHVEPDREDELKPDRLTEEDVRKMRREYEEGGVSQYDLAEKYGISQGQVWSIVNYEQWGHVD